MSKKHRKIHTFETRDNTDWALRNKPDPVLQAYLSENSARPERDALERKAKRTTSTGCPVLPDPAEQGRTDSASKLFYIP